MPETHGPKGRLECPSCKNPEVKKLRYQFEEYLQCAKCKFWSTKYTPDDPGIFLKGGK